MDECNDGIKSDKEDKGKEFNEENLIISEGSIVRIIREPLSKGYLRYLKAPLETQQRESTHISGDCQALKM